MCEPDEQDYRSSVRSDDPKIGANDLLYRHCRSPVQVVPVKREGKEIGAKISDQAFKGKSGEAGISIDHGCLLRRAGLTWSNRYGLMPNTFAMLSVTAAQARAQSGGVAWTPKPSEPELDGFAALPNPFHGEIILPMTNRQVRDLFAVAQIVHSDIPPIPA